MVGYRGPYRGTMEKISLGKLSGSSSRTYATREVTRSQVTRPVHVAIAMWEQPWKSGKDAEKRGWVIAIDGGKERRRVLEDGVAKRDPDPLAVEVLQRELRTMGVPIDDVWVVTGKRQIALRNLLENTGFDVSGSFSPQNRAVQRATGLMQRRRKSTSTRVSGGERRRRQRLAQQSAPETQWLPGYSRAQATNVRNVTISCDASSDTHSTGSVCFVASNGDFEVETFSTNASIDDLELVALTKALRYAVQSGASSAVIESDSAGALAAARWMHKRGCDGRRRGGIRGPVRQDYYDAWREAKESVDLRMKRVLGHSGDPLNKAADQIAYLAMRATVHPRTASEAALKKGISTAVAEATGMDPASFALGSPVRRRRRRRGGGRRRGGQSTQSPG